MSVYLDYTLTSVLYTQKDSLKHEEEYGFIQTNVGGDAPPNI